MLQEQLVLEQLFQEHNFGPNLTEVYYPAGCTSVFDIKGIVSDSNIIFLWQKLEDINEERLFSKFQLIPIFCLQVMHDFVHWYYSIDYCVK